MRGENVVQAWAEVVTLLHSHTPLTRAGATIAFEFSVDFQRRYVEQVESSHHSSQRQEHLGYYIVHVSTLRLACIAPAPCPVTPPLLEDLTQ
jgi:hypothetical protein